MPKPDGDSLAELPSALRMSLLRSARRIRQQRVHTEITWSQMSALATVAKGQSMTAGEIAARERVQPPSMTRILANLESSGLITREAHATDRRCSTISVTAKGREVLAAEAQARDEWLAHRLAELSTSDLEVLRDVIPVLDRLAAE